MTVQSVTLGALKREKHIRQRLSNSIVKMKSPWSGWAEVIACLNKQELTPDPNLISVITGIQDQNLNFPYFFLGPHILEAFEWL